jgi:hypothetical protein
MQCPNCGALIIDAPHSRESQNLLHTIIRAIASEQGEDVERVKLRVKIEVLQPILYDTFVAGVEENGPPKYRGAWVDLHDVYEQYVEGTYAFVKSEADYTKRQDTEAIEVAIRWAVECGIDVERL